MDGWKESFVVGVGRILRTGTKPIFAECPATSEPALVRSRDTPRKRLPTELQYSRVALFKLLVFTESYFNSIYQVTFLRRLSQKPVVFSLLVGRFPGPDSWQSQFFPSGHRVCIFRIAGYSS